MKGTKQKILDKARLLFNTHGYNHVTIRMIANALEMSSGNLNYHFRKREDILELLYFEMVEEFDKRVGALSNQILTLEFMYLNIQVSMVRMLEYRFFWTDLYNILKSNRKIKSHFEKVRVNRVGGYEFLFANFIKQGIMQSPSYDDEYSLLIERMIDYSNTWIYASALYDSKKDSKKIIDNTSIQLLSMIYPYLKNDSRKDFHRIHLKGNSKKNIDC